MRLKCPRCSMIVEGAPGTQITCSSCGFTATAPAAPPPAWQPAPAPAHPPSMPAMAPPGAPTAPPAILNPNHGPVGKRRDPWAVVILCVITLGIYYLVWAWKTSREVDAFMQRPAGSHPKMKLGIVLQVTGIVLAFFGLIVMFPDFVELAMAEEGTTPPINAGRVAIGFLLILIGAALALAGIIVIIVAFYKIWKMIEEDDQRRLASKPFNPTLALILVILGFFVPYVGFVLPLIAYYLTQDALNKTWDAYGMAPPMPSSPA